MPNESEEVIVNGFHVFPYKYLDDAEKDLDYDKDHFGIDFNVRKFRKGYIVISEKQIVDARGFCLSDSSPLENGVETFYEISREVGSN